MVEELLSGHDFESVLDYGCGKKAYTARRFSVAGKRVVGFDPGDGIKTRWERDQYAKDLTLTDSGELAISGGPYDAVVCSLVLCELRSEKDFQQVVRDLGAFGQEYGQGRCRDMRSAKYLWPPHGYPPGKEIAPKSLNTP